MKTTVNWNIVNELKNITTKATGIAWENLHLSWYVVRHGYIHIHLNEKVFAKYNTTSKTFEKVEYAF